MSLSLLLLLLPSLLFRLLLSVLSVSVVDMVDIDVSVPVAVVCRSPLLRRLAGRTLVGEAVQCAGIGIVCDDVGVPTEEWVGFWLKNGEVATDTEEEEAEIEVETVGEGR